MAHKRKDSYTASPEHWRHLRPDNKRRVAKAERRAARTLISVDQVADRIAKRNEELFKVALRGALYGKIHSIETMTPAEACELLTSIRRNIDPAKLREAQELAANYTRARMGMSPKEHERQAAKQHIRKEVTDMSTLKLIQTVTYVPMGEYCRGGPKGATCPHCGYSNTLVPFPTCDVGFSGQSDDATGVHKSPECLRLSKQAEKRTRRGG